MHTQQYLLSEMARYIHNKDISLNLLAELREWVVGGNSVYDNSWNLAGEKVYPLDYIAAKDVVNERKK